MKPPISPLMSNLLASPLHLPVVRAPCQRLSAENLSPEVEAFRMVWWVQVLSPQCGLTTSIWQLQMAIHRVGIHGGFEANWSERMHFSEDSGAPEGFDTVIYSVFILLNIMDLHFSNSPLVFGSGWTSPIVVTGGAKRKKKMYISNQGSKIIYVTFSISASCTGCFFCVFCVYLEVEEEGRVEGGLKLHVQRDGGERKWRTQVYQMISKLRYRLSYSYLEDMQDEVEI